MEITKMLEELSLRAVEEGKKLSRVLDFSEQSMQDVEEILDCFNKNMACNSTNDMEEEIVNKQLWNKATVWGAYVGEVICRNNSDRCKWAYEESKGQGIVLYVQVDNNNRAYPIDKVYKRLKNGPDDNIKSFYDIFKFMVLTNKLS